MRTKKKSVKLTRPEQTLEPFLQSFSETPPEDEDELEEYAPLPMEEVTKGYEEAPNLMDETENSEYLLNSTAEQEEGDVTYDIEEPPLDEPPELEPVEDTVAVETEVPPSQKHAYARNYKCPQCPFMVKSSKPFLYHMIREHGRSMNVYSCHLCEYGCKQRHKVQRHLKLVHNKMITIEEVQVEYQCESSQHSSKRNDSHGNNSQASLYVDTESPTMVPIQSRIRTPLKVKIALPPSTSKLAAALTSATPILGSGVFDKHIALLTSGGQKLFKCRQCVFSNKDKSVVVKHVQAMHLSIFKCIKCKFQTTDRQAFVTHRAKHSKGEMYRCTECSYRTEFKTNLDRHKQNHESSFAYKCEFCTYSSDHEGIIKRHMTQCHGNGASNMTIVFPNSDPPVNGAGDSDLDHDFESSQDHDALSSHSGDTLGTEEGSMNLSFMKDEPLPRLMTVEGCYFCPLCGLRYKRSSDLNRHMKRKHDTTINDYLVNMEGVSEFAGEDADPSNQDEDDEEGDERGGIPGRRKCTSCNYVAKWQSELDRHMASHHAEKRYKCPHCSKQYKYLGDLNVHLRRDHRDKPVGNGRLVKVPTAGALHKSSPSIFKCPSCPFMTQFKGEIDSHSKIHKAEKPFRCNNCDYQSHWKGDIRRHVYRHHAECLEDDSQFEELITVDNDLLHHREHTKNTIVIEPLDGEEEEMERQIDENDDDNDDDEDEPQWNYFDNIQPEDAQESRDSFNNSNTSETSPKLPKPKDGIFRCSFCTFTTNAPSKLSMHEATHTNLKQYKCPECGRRANWKWDIRKHIRKEHPHSTAEVVKLSKEEAEATIKDYMSSNPCVRREHHLNASPTPSRDEYGEKTYKCGACPYTSSMRASVSRHIRGSHPGQNVDMYVDDDEDDEVQLNFSKSSTPGGYNNNHEASPAPSNDSFNSEKPYICAACGKTANMKVDIRKHYHYKHPNMTIRILYSDAKGTRELPSEDSLAAGKRKISASLLQNFSTDAPEEKRINLSLNSKTPHMASSTLKDFVLTETVLKPFMCGECGKRSGTKADIKKHYNYMHPRSEVKIIYQENESSPFIKQEASTANRASTSPRKTSVPLMSANPKKFGYSKPFKCSICGRRSNWKWDLGKHMRAKHPGVEGHIITLSAKEARETYEQYMKDFSVANYQTQSKRELMGYIDEQYPVSYPSKGVYKEFKCSACPYRSNWRSDIQRHMRRKHGGRARLVIMDRAEAKASLEEYKYDPRRENKQEMVSPEKDMQKFLWKCGKCTFKSNDNKVVISHLATHKVKAFRCTLCNYATNYRSSAVRHVKIRHHSDNLSLCRVSVQCIKLGNKGNKNMSIMGSDERDEEEYEEFTMEEESEDFGEEMEDSSASEVLSPAKTLSNLGRKSYDVYKCKLCKFESTWRSCVARHIREKHDTDRKERSECITTVVRGGNHSHGATQQGEKRRRYSCSICPFQTNKQKSLQFHMNCHKPSPEKSKCPYCPYYVRIQRLLDQHIRLHTGYVYPKLNGSMTDGDNSMQISDLDSTADSSLLSAPVSHHSPAKRHVCDQCPYTSNSKNDFMYHKQFHQQKPGADYKCHVCEYWVTHKRLLKQHLKIHETLPKSPSKCGSVASSPCKSDFSENSSIHDMVQLATYKQKVIASKIMPSISQKPVMSPMKLACSVGTRPGYVVRNGVYKKLHKCSKCPYMNVRLRNLKLHEMMHGRRTAKSQLLKCPHCDYFVGSKGLLSHHLKVHQPNYMADMADTTISDLEDMEGVQVEDEDSLDKPEEGETIPHENKVDTLYEIARFKKYSCEKCPYASAKRSHYERHVELHGSRQRCSCRYCDYSVQSMNLLAQHEKLHLVPNQNLLVAQSLSNLLQLPQVPADVALSSAIPPLDSQEGYTIDVTHDHLNLYENSTEHDNEPKKLYRCDKCPYANVRRDHLLSHLKFHMLKGDLQCPYCDYSVAKQHLLTQHIKVHFSPLPELSNWLVQNGQMDRVEEIKEPDITEALQVAELLMNQQKEKQKSTAEAENNNEEKEAKKEEEVVAKEEEVKGQSTAKEKETTNDAVGGSKEETDIPNEGKAPKDDSASAAGETTDPRSPSPQPSTSGHGNEGSHDQIGDLGGESADKHESYICQYCDRALQASDELVKHEMQHLIGNNFETVEPMLIEQQV